MTITRTAIKHQDIMLEQGMHGDWTLTIKANGVERDIASSVLLTWADVTALKLVVDKIYDIMEGCRNE